MLTVAPVFATASLTVSKTGMVPTIVPPFLGVTPPTICVPYSRHFCAWKLPALPVTPCTITLEFLSTRTDMGAPVGFGLFDGPGGCLVDGAAGDDAQARVLQKLPPL